MVGFSVIYRLGPNRTAHPKGWVTLGAEFATFCWAGALAGFSIYLTNFAAYNKFYGSIGAVIAMLICLFISAWLVLLGGALNAELEARENPAP